MTALLGDLATLEGVHPTALDGVQLMRASQPIPRIQVLYEPGIVIVGQRRKRGYLGDQVYTYDAHNYLVPCRWRRIRGAAGSQQALDTSARRGPLPPNFRRPGSCRK
jgi:hypothetical protein